MKNFKKGFTLIELIIVIAIVALISTATLAVLNPFGQFNKARDAKMKSDLSQIQKALEAYYQDNGRYPPNASSCTYGISGNNNDGNDCIEWGKSWQPYMNVLPADVIKGHRYVYYSSFNGQSYYLYANLNNSKDPQACNYGAACLSLSANGIPSNACGATCNFGVTSPNVRP